MAKSKSKPKSKTKITEEIKQKMRKLLADGLRKIDISRELDISYSCVRRHLNGY